MNAAPPHLYSLLIYICIFTAAILFSKYIITQYTNLSSNPGTRLFAIGFLSTILLASINTIWSGSALFDLQWHDTYWVIATFHLYLAVALILGLWTLAYYLIPTVMKRSFNKGLSAVHAWISVATLLLIIFFVSGQGHYYKEANMYKSQYADLFIFICLFIFLTSQLIFVINLIYSLWKPQQK